MSRVLHTIFGGSEGNNEWCSLKNRMKSQKQNKITHTRRSTSAVTVVIIGQISLAFRLSGWRTWVVDSPKTPNWVGFGMSRPSNQNNVILDFSFPFENSSNFLTTQPQNLRMTVADLDSQAIQWIKKSFTETDLAAAWITRGGLQ